LNGAKKYADRSRASNNIFSKYDERGATHITQHMTKNGHPSEWLRSRGLLFHVIVVHLTLAQKATNRNIPSKHILFSYNKKEEMTFTLQMIYDGRVMMYDPFFQYSLEFVARTRRKGTDKNETRDIDKVMLKTLRKLI
jgi:hypothetical protein